MRIAQATYWKSFLASLVLIVAFSACNNDKVIVSPISEKDDGPDTECTTSFFTINMDSLIVSQFFGIITVDLCDCDSIYLIADEDFSGNHLDLDFFWEVYDYRNDSLYVINSDTLLVTPEINAALVSETDFPPITLLEVVSISSDSCGSISSPLNIIDSTDLLRFIQQAH